MSCNKPRNVRRIRPHIVRLPTPIITSEELLSECAPREPVGLVDALTAAELVLAEHLRLDLENFPYREQSAHPRAVWARVNAVTLARVRSALARQDLLQTELSRLIAGERGQE